VVGSKAATGSSGAREKDADGSGAQEEDAGGNRQSRKGEWRQRGEWPSGDVSEETCPCVTNVDFETLKRVLVTCKRLQH
jgi:hypothetical protein